VSHAPEQPAARDTALAQAWQAASRDEPAAAMDDAIRAAARKAVQSRPRPVGVSPFGGRWRVPLSVAALVVVSATVTLLVAERDRRGVGALHDQAAPAPAAPAPQAQMSTVPSDASAPAQRQFAERAAPEPGTGVAASSEQSKQTAPPALEERKRQVSPPVPASAEQPQAGEQFSERAMRPTPAARADRGGTPSAGSEPAKGTPAAPVAPPIAHDEAASNAAAQVRAEDALPGVAKREEQTAAKAKERTAAEAPAAAPLAAPRAIAPQGAGSSAEPRAMTRPAPPAQAAAAQAESAAPNLEPKAWLDRIAELRRQGKLQEAGESLKAFRERYPDYPLPPELKDLP